MRILLGNEVRHLRILDGQPRRDVSGNAIHEAELIAMQFGEVIRLSVSAAPLLGRDLVQLFADNMRREEASSIVSTAITRSPVSTFVESTRSNPP